MRVITKQFLSEVVDVFGLDFLLKQDLSRYEFEDEELRTLVLTCGENYRTLNEYLHNVNISIRPFSAGQTVIKPSKLGQVE